MEYTEINKRYSELAETACCLSCGGAINYSGAAKVRSVLILEAAGAQMFSDLPKK